MGFEDLELLVIAVVLVIVAVSYFAGKLGVAAPILLVVIGIGLSLIPGLPPIAPARCELLRERGQRRIDSGTMRLEHD